MRRILVTKSFDRTPICVETYYIGTMLRQSSDKPIHRKEYRRLEIVEDESEPRTREIRIERHVCSAGFEDSHDCYRNLERPLETDRYQHFRSNALTTKIMSKLIRPSIQLL